MLNNFFNLAHTMKAFVNKAFMVGLFFTTAIMVWASLAITTPAMAHTYFFAVSDIHYNEQSKRIEIIHQFTAHDIENTIAEIKQVNFSPEHPQYDKFVQDYFEANFHLTLAAKQKTLSLKWIGFEVKRGKLYAYQESEQLNALDNLMVTNTVLTSEFPKQVNTVNYECRIAKEALSFKPDANHPTASHSVPELMQASLTFDAKVQSGIMTTTCK